MRWNKLWIIAVAALFFVVGCDEGQDDFNSSARFSGNVRVSLNDNTGVRGVQIIIETDPDGDNTVSIPDKWFETDSEGHFDGAIFLGRNADNSDYNYIADMSISYFYNGTVFSWDGGATIAPGSHFTVPTVYLTDFRPLVDDGQ